VRDPEREEDLARPEAGSEEDDAGFTGRGYRRASGMKHPEKSEDFLDKVVTDAEAGAGFDGAGETGIEDVRDEVVVRRGLDRLDGDLLRGLLVGGL